MNIIQQTNPIAKQSPFDFDVVMWSWLLPTSPADVDEEVKPDKGQEQIVTKEHGVSPPFYYDF